MNDKTKAIIAVGNVIVETVKELGSTPEGVMYAHLMGIMDLRTFTCIVDALVAVGRLRRSNHILSAG